MSVPRSKYKLPQHDSTRASYVRSKNRNEYSGGLGIWRGFCGIIGPGADSLSWQEANFASTREGFVRLTEHDPFNPDPSERLAGRCQAKTQGDHKGGDFAAFRNSRSEHHACSYDFAVNSRALSAPQGKLPCQLALQLADRFRDSKLSIAVANEPGGCVVGIV